MGKREGKKPLASPRLRREYNIKIDLKEVEWGAWTGTAQNRERWPDLVNAVKNV